MNSTARLFVCILTALCPFSVRASSTSDSTRAPATSAPVLIGGDTVLTLAAPLGSFGPEERAQKITATLQSILDHPSSDTLRVVDFSGMSYITSGETVVMTITDHDASLAGENRDVLARQYSLMIQERLTVESDRHASRDLLKRLLILLGLFAGTVLVFIVLRMIFPRFYTYLEGYEGKILRPIRFKSHEFVGKEALAGFLVLIARAIRFGLSIAVFYLLVEAALDLLPWTQSLTIRPLLTGVLLTMFALIIAGVVGKMILSFFSYVKRTIPGWEGTFIHSVRLRTMEIIPARNIISSLVLVAKIVQTILLLLLAYVTLTTIFTFFGFTKTWSAALLTYLAHPLTSLASAVLNYLPNLFFILVIGVVTNYVLRFIKLIFQGLESNAIRFPGFYPEWSIPTYKIVRFLILAFVAVIVFPYLPGSNSPAFQGISIFLGILFSLGSSSAIANIVAGVVLTYMRPFRPGDRVKIADAMGDVVEKTLLVTRIRTVKNVDISIPNAMVLGSHIINYNSSSAEKGLILHTSVTIGYDVPWRRVHELLLSAARGTPSILPDPPPFVLQAALDDFYVRYELNAYTDRPNEMSRTYSALHQSIQDSFFDAGVEICSPHFTALRDGNAASIPQDHLPAGYKAPAFRIHLPGFPGGRDQGRPSTPPDDAGGQQTGP